MAKKKVLVTGVIPEEGLGELYEVFDVDYANPPLSREEVLKILPQYEGILLMGQKADKEFIDAAPNLKIIAVNAVGFDHVDIEYAKEKGIVVANAPLGVQVPTAEMTLSLILATVKRLSFYDKLIRRGEWIDVSERKYMGLSLDGATVGIFGMGRIGKKVAELLKPFNSKIIYNDAFRLDEKVEKELGVEYRPFDDLVAEADVITVHAPILDSTRHVFNKDTFKKMKNSSYFINAARGPIAKEEDLLEALKTGEIAGAGLDVFESEPNVVSDYFDLENVIMSPHAATGTVKGRTDIAKEASANIISYLRDNVETNRVNK